MLFGGTKEMCHYIQLAYLFTHRNELWIQKKINIARSNRAHDELLLSLMPLWLNFAARNAIHFYERPLIEYNLDGTTLKPNYPHSLLNQFSTNCAYPFRFSPSTCAQLDTQMTPFEIGMYSYKISKSNRTYETVNSSTTTQTRWIIKIQNMQSTTAVVVRAPIVNGDKLLAKLCLEIRCNRFRNNALILVGPWSRVVNTLHTHSHLTQPTKPHLLFAKQRNGNETRKSFGCCSAIAVIHRSLVGWRIYGINIFFCKRHVNSIYRRALLLPTNGNRFVTALVAMMNRIIIIYYHWIRCGGDISLIHHPCIFSIVNFSLSLPFPFARIFRNSCRWCEVRYRCPPIVIQKY